MRNTKLSAHIVLCSIFGLLTLPAPAWAVDTDGDGVDDSADLCCNTPAGVTVDTQGRPKGDFDLDCDVDQEDFGIFQANMTGPMTCPAEGCACPCGDGFANCDGQSVNGCEFNLNANPACSGFTELGTISGDTGFAIISRNDHGEKWYRIRITENDNTIGVSVPLQARIRLTPPAGTNYDLHAYCTSCGGTTSLSSQNGGSDVETVYMAKPDTSGGDDSKTILIEVRFISGNICDNWQLEIAGNVTVGPLWLECP